MSRLFGLLPVAVAGGLAVACPSAPGPPVTVLQLAPGVHVRQMPADNASAANQGWVVFDDHVLVIDSGIPPDAVVTLDAISRSTELPIRFVVNTHHHGDHSYANALFVARGAEVIAAESGRELHETRTRVSLERVRERWDHVAPGIEYNAPTVWMADRMTFKEASQQVELLHLGHGHTPDDIVVWLPGSGVLFTGDLVLNGPANFAGHADTSGWIRVLEELARLPVRTVVPGHGPIGGPELIELQRRYLEETRSFVARRMADGRTREQIEREIQLPFYEEWTGVAANRRRSLIYRVYAELGADADLTQGTR